MSDLSMPTEGMESLGLAMARNLILQGSIRIHTPRWLLMKTIRIAVPLIAAVLFSCSFALAQEGSLSTDPPKGTTPEAVIQAFAAKEAQFKAARDNYTFRQDVRVQTLDGDTVTGEYREVFDVTYDDRHQRLENVVFAPQNTLADILMTPEDLQDIRHLLPFVLTSEEIPEYNILYVGEQQEDEIHCYVFDIAPKRIEGKKRYFQGRIWVDDQDLQIVKTSGKTVPDIRKKNDENLFPKFTTWRENVDGKYWFPAYTLADDTLHFKLSDVHIREIVKYTDYKQFGSRVIITYEGKELPKGQQKPGDQKPDDQKPQ
jgi:hypothetical protein